MTSRRLLVRLGLVVLWVWDGLVWLVTWPCEL